ncbi:type II toxin-antitoxin system RelB/DinJ family antitoxin [Leuconostoc mesenteroides]|uniref:type II toxin-antitoxin system RelB/DinJ family antitoxin n=1 Tax=Leuconostoc mesenteroides TaxID=1245 RepID=UPI000A03301B|nr:type II toxin-antitoxin system RelB/DinJ family antitoxin [Leuconostoc mesenteroides]ORI79353.1 hypothetical protein BMS92_08555 [Leuconostoc mesenteroides subsp. mesenteroides]
MATVINEKRVQVKVDADLKTDVDRVLDALGLSQTALITALYKRVAASGGVPFDLQMTERERLTNRLLTATNQLPVLDLTTDDKALEAWFDEA